MGKCHNIFIEKMNDRWKPDSVALVGWLTKLKLTGFTRVDPMISAAKLRQLRASLGGEDGTNRPRRAN